MRSKKLFTLACIICLSSNYVQADSEPSPYVGQETRDIKALSEQEINDYLAGNGMGLAKAAELNHYPGPRHVLDLASDLKLTNEQIKQSTAVFEDMQSRAQTLGEKIIEKEAELDLAFANNKIDQNSLDSLLKELGLLQAQLRYTHLNAHLAQREILTTAQISQYDQLRGYTGSAQPNHQHHHNH